METPLNDGQRVAVEAAVKWFKYSSEQTFSIIGGGGTGKTYVLHEIIRRLGLSKNDILPMAYTGQAAIVMRTRGLTNACTCHSGLFTPVQDFVRDENGKVVMDKQFNTPLVKWKYVLKDFSTSDIKLIVLDEAWMIPQRFKKFIDNTKIKVLAVGDPGQLPPIADNPGYLIDGTIYELTELMRQSRNSPIVYLANRARHDLPIEPGFYGNDVLVIFDDELDNNIIAHSNIILCAKNKTRENMNSLVRNQILGITTDYPNYGERMICRKNNWGKEVEGIALVNGLVGSVITPPSIGKFKDGLMTLNFIPDLLSTPFLDLSINHKYLNATYSEKELMKNSPYIKGELFEYAYASTVHLAQGSEYYSGTYIEEYMGKDVQKALNYTAITRFKQKMIYVKHRPKFWSV